MAERPPNRLLKRQALDAVLREYNAFFKVGQYMEDTRSLCLLTLCAMIDIAHHRCPLTDKQCDNTGSSSEPWNLDRLAQEDRHYFSHANWPCNNRALSAEQCYQRMLKMLYDSPFF